ncbi:High mobility group B protein 14 [Glycine max]|nr:High mobility group B protein 14 [Glycine max]
MAKDIKRKVLRQQWLTSMYCEIKAECRRQTLLKHFGESFDRRDCKYGSSPCDNCLKTVFKLVLWIKSDEESRDQCGRLIQERNSKQSKSDAMKPKKPLAAFFLLFNVISKEVLFRSEGKIFIKNFKSRILIKLVLRIESNEGIKRSEWQTNSRKKPKAKQKKNKQMFDAMKPKKSPEDFRKEFQEQNPDIKSMYDIGKACGEKWKTMTYENASSCTRFARTQSESNRRNCLLSATRYIVYLLILFPAMQEIDQAQMEQLHKKIEDDLEIGNASGKKWISMTNEEKVKYYDIASEKRIEFDRAMAKFNNKMVSNHSFSLLLSCLLFARKLVLWIKSNEESRDQCGRLIRERNSKQIKEEPAKLY